MQFNIKDAKHREKLLFEIMYYIMGLKYMDRKKFLYIPEEYITDGGYPLGRIWAELKEAYEQNMLSEEEIRFLLNLRMQLTDSPYKKMEIWLNRADEAEEYYKVYGTLSMPNEIALCQCFHGFRYGLVGYAGQLCNLAVRIFQLVHKCHIFDKPQDEFQFLVHDSAQCFAKAGVENLIEIHVCIGVYWT